MRLTPSSFSLWRTQTCKALSSHQNTSQSHNEQLSVQIKCCLLEQSCHDALPDVACSETLNPQVKSTLVTECMGGIDLSFSHKLKPASTQSCSNAKYIDVDLQLPYPCPSLNPKPLSFPSPIVSSSFQTRADTILLICLDSDNKLKRSNLHGVLLPSEGLQFQSSTNTLNHPGCVPCHTCNALL